MSRGRGAGARSGTVRLAPAHPRRGSGLDPEVYGRWVATVRGLAGEHLHVHMPSSPPPLALDGRPSPVIAVDLDSTVFPLLDVIGSFPEHTGFSMEEVGHWDYLVDRFGGIAPLLDLFDRAMSREHSLEVAPYDGAVQVLDGLVRRHNARVVVMTDRPLRRVEDTIAYADAYRLPYAAILCGRLPDKTSACQTLEAQILVDDRPSTIEAAHAAGLSPLTLAHPYTAEVRQRLGLASHLDWHSIASALEDLLGPGSAQDPPGQPATTAG